MSCAWQQTPQVANKGRGGESMTAELINRWGSKVLSNCQWGREGAVGKKCAKAFCKGQNIFIPHITLILFA